MQPNNFHADPELKRLYWHSRRGMLELDLLLVPFARDCLATLTVEQREAYRQLLAEEDQDLYVWLTRREVPADATLEAAVALVLAHGSRFDL
ncbi:MAG TPA: succinate dehydrogenase assembly factor 2 [Hyphomicrobiales bacterium]|nr:succinate dehydrogenase assembly factor 2 [Hyphomicrobiales bacterium]